MQASPIPKRPGRALGPALAVASVLAGCTPGHVGSDGPPPSAPRLAASSYCAAASAVGLVTWSGSLQTRCPEADFAADHGVEGCRHYRIGDGQERELPLLQVRRVLDVGEGAMVLWREDGSLLLRGASGEERLLAGWADDPSVGSGVASIAYLTVDDLDLEEDEHGREPVPGAALRVVLQSVTGPAEVVAVDPEAASPWPLPDGSGVLFVSTRTGLASLWRARPGEPEVQLTNVDLEEVGQGFVPVPSSELLWLPDGRAVFATHTEREELWLLDPRSGDAERLGPGSRPRLDARGDVLALGGTEGGCALRYRIGGRP